MTDVTKISNIIIGMEVKTILINDSSKTSSGIVYKIISLCDNPNGIEVMLTNGDQGNVISIENSIEVIIKRIMDTESDVSDNKQNFYDNDMTHEAIPHVVSSFMNADGGYVYIGVVDSAKSLDEKLIGLKPEKDILVEKLSRNPNNKIKELTDQKFYDTYRDDIEKALKEHLTTSTRLGKLTDFNFIKINDKTILEIIIRKSPAPVFYSNPPRKKHSEFSITLGNKRTSRELDEFHFRNGSSKGHCHTFEDFLEFYEKNFLTK
jgi:predicted HTH transcriptional regulator